jgi:hypothetical protein
VPRFPITVWPGVIEEITVHAPPRVTFTEGAAWDMTAGGEEWDQYELPPEFYLRQVFAVDLDDDNSIRAFIEEWGFLFDWWEGRNPNHEPDLWEMPPDLGNFMYDNAGPALEDHGPFWRERHYRSLRYEKRPSPRFELFLETRIGIAWLRDLVRLWDSNKTSEFKKLPTQWETGTFGVPKPKSKEQALNTLIEGVNDTVGDLRTRLIRPGETIGYAVSPFRGAMIQLFNHVAQDIPYRRCANETCRRRFVHQVEGASEYGQYRSDGVMYCSNRCARAQAQREYRKRQKRSKLPSSRHGKR